MTLPIVPVAVIWALPPWCWGRTMVDEGRVCNKAQALGLKHIKLFGGGTQEPEFLKPDDFLFIQVLE